MYVQFDTNCKITLKPIQFAARNCIFYYNLVVFAFVIIILSEIFRHYNISFLFEVSNLGKNTSHQDITSNLMLELTRGGGRARGMPPSRRRSVRNQAAHSYKHIFRMEASNEGNLIELIVEIYSVI